MTDYKLPPHNDEAELLVLSAILADNSVINELDNLLEDHFYRLENKTVFRRMSAMATIGQPIDPVTLMDALDEAGDMVGSLGPDYIADIAMNGRGGTNVKHYASILVDKAMSRKLIQAAQLICDAGYEGGDFSQKIDKAQSLINGLVSGGSRDPRHIDAILLDVVSDIDRRARIKGGVIGQQTGFYDLDKLTGGFQPGQLIVIAGRPGSGKTTFAMNICENVVQEGKNVLVFNLEMIDVNLAMKTISSIGRIPYSKMRSGDIDEHTSELNVAAMKLKGKNLYIDDNGSLSSNQIISRARKIAQKLGGKIDMIVVDYLQLLNDKGDGVQRITEISRALKMAARELDCPLLALSQLNRSLENRPNKRPVLSDLRESGAIEQDADTVIMVYRDELHDDNSTRKGLAEAIVRKNREGEPGTVHLAANLHICRFDNLDPSMIPREQSSGRGKPSPFAKLDN